jgi:RNase P protein component
LKEWFRLNRRLVPGNRTYDCWIVVKQKFERTDMPEINRLLTSVLEKIDRK